MTTATVIVTLLLAALFAFAASIKLLGMRPRNRRDGGAGELSCDL
jgi:hypothetical protein